MFDIKKLEDNSIIITPNSFKKDILLETNKLDLELKFMSKGELEENTFFSYGEEATTYLIKEKHYSYANAKEILKNLYYLKEGNEKLNELVSIKNELKEHKLLKYNYYFSSLFVNKKVYIYHYSKLDKELLTLLRYNKCDYEYLLDIEEFNLPKVYKFDEIEEEVDHMFNMIVETLDKNKNLNLNDIKLYSYPSEYELIIKKYARFYNLPINFKKEMKLVHSPYFTMFLNKYDETTLEETYNYLVDEIKVDNYNFLAKIKNLLIQVKGLFENKEDERKYIISKANEIYLSRAPFEEGIDIVDCNYAKDDYIFVLGFNLLTFPKVNRDVSYLNDEDKTLLGINTTEIENQIEEENIIRFIKTHSHLTISYKEHIGKEVYYPSLLINKLGLEEISSYDYKTSYSKASLKNRTCIALDLKETYGIESENLNSLPKEDLDYRTFSHKFKPFEKAKRSFVKLAPTTISNYFECPFKYYLKKVLYVKDFEENFNAQLGTFFHKILEESTIATKEVIKENLTVDNVETLRNLIDQRTNEVVEEYRNKVDGYFKEYSQKFLASKLIDQINSVVKLNTEILMQNRNLDVKVEFEDEIDLDEHTKLSGKVDKMLISNQEDNKYLLIVDYKTGGTSFEREKIEHGISLQLPLYSLVESVVNEKYDQLGIYIQNILNKDVDLRLNGITKNDENLIISFEPAFASSKKSNYIYGIERATKKEGFYFKSDKKNLLTKEEFEEIRQIAKEKALEASKNIQEGKFDISPYYIDERSEGCAHCTYKDLCFKEKEDFRFLKIKKRGEE